MKARTTLFRLRLFLTLALCTHIAHAQDSPTYTVDPNFNTGNLFRAGSGIGSLVLYEDGRILAGGGFSPFVHWSPFNGLGMVWADGSEFTDWGGGENSSVPQVVRYLDGFIAPLIGGLGKYTENGTPTYILGLSHLSKLFTTRPTGSHGYFTYEPDWVLCDRCRTRS